MAFKIIASTPDLCFAVQYVPVGISVDRNDTFISYPDDKFCSVTSEQIYLAGVTEYKKTYRPL